MGTEQDRDDHLRRSSSIAGDPVPFVSIIMPVRNEGNFIAKSLGAVMSQDYPRERMEVIVVDGISTDSTRLVVESFKKNYANLHMIDNPGMIVPKGMNIAMARAKGEIIVRVDGHCVIAQDYVRRCVDHLQSDHVDGVGGSVSTKGETKTSRVIAAAMSSRFGVGGSAFRTMFEKTKFVDTVPFPAYTRSIIERAGPYDEELVRNQDDEYNYRLRKLGGRLLLAKDVKSEYYSRSSIRSLGRQYFQYGYWKVRVMQKHPRQMSARQFVPAVFVVGLVGSCVYALGWGGAGTFAFLLLVSAYLTANLVASFLNARRDGRDLIPLLPVAFGTIHLSYGTGFILGLVRFLGRWGPLGQIKGKREPAFNDKPRRP